MMLKPGGPPKLGRHVTLRVSNGLADANARKERAKATMAERMVIMEKRAVDISGECKRDTRRC
jgi:hypothetical protein